MQKKSCGSLCLLSFSERPNPAPSLSPAPTGIYPSWGGFHSAQGTKVVAVIYPRVLSWPFRLEEHELEFEQQKAALAGDQLQFAGDNCGTVLEGC